MNNVMEQTVRQYAKISKIPLRQVLDDLKKAGFPCSANDVLDKNMRQELSRLFNQRYIEEVRAEAFMLSKQTIQEYAKIYKIPVSQILEALKNSGFSYDADDVLDKEMYGKIPEFLYQFLHQKHIADAEANAGKTFRETSGKLKKIGKLIDLCVELTPKALNSSIMEATNNQLVSDILIGSYYEYLKNCFLTKKDNNKHWEARQWLSKQIVIPKWIIDDYQLGDEFLTDDVDDLRESIYERKKHKCYTAGLMEVIAFLINLDFSCDVYAFNFKNFSFIGELLIDMGAIDSALRLYAIDEKMFNLPNKLSLLTSNAIKVGNLEWSIKLIEKLIEQEPYHPSISTMQAEIKRLEQRERLKSTFSIDFAKLDELSGVEFENLLMDKFIAMGFKVESTPKTGDFGADLIVENREDTRIIVQCKRFKSKVNLKAVQEVVGAIGHYGGDMGLVITNNSFLNSAVKLAESHDIELWDGDKLVSFLAGDLSFSEIMGSSQVTIA